MHPENHISSEAIKIGETDTIKRYLSLQDIYAYIKKSPSISFSKQFPKPFDSIQFDKVIAYDFDGNTGRIMSVIDRYGFFVDVVTNQQALAHNQVEQFINFITDEKSY